MQTTEHDIQPGIRQVSRTSRIGLTILAAAVGVALPTVLSGCTTTKGFGEDLESLGENISDEAEDANGD